jgi:hypothetical protein
VVTLRQRYLLVRGLGVSKDLQRAKALSGPVEAGTLQEQILLAEGKGGLEIGGVILKAAKDAAAELSAVLPMASAGAEEDAFVPLMSLMDALALSQKAVEEETGKREGAVLLQALVVQVFAWLCLPGSELTMLLSLRPRLSFAFALCLSRCMCCVCALVDVIVLCTLVDVIVELFVCGDGGGLCHILVTGFSVSGSVRRLCDLTVLHHALARPLVSLQARLGL